ncbi:MAG: hypothetical protein ACW99Q_28425 [Candidatus Kariarchaeaceae archaeon]
MVSHSEQRYFRKDVIDYLDYVFPNPTYESASHYLVEILNRGMMTYNDAHLIDESEYFTKEKKMSVDSYKIIRRDRIDTEESRRAYFLKSSQLAVRTFF